MTYSLYYAPDSAAMCVRVLLEEIGAEYELIDTTIEMDKPRPVEQLALNPNGWVPVLLWDGGSMYECAAITIYLCDSHPESGLAPALDDPTRSLFLQTLVYFSNTVQIAFQQYYYPQRFTYSEDGLQSALERGVQRLHQVWKIVDDQIGDGQWVLGDQFSAADIYLYMLTTWFVPEDGHPDLSSLSNVSRVVSKVAERPSVQRVYGS